MSMRPNQGDLFDIVLMRDEAQKIQYVLRLEIMKKEEDRGFMLVQELEVRQEKIELGACGHYHVVTEEIEDDIPF